MHLSHPCLFGSSWSKGEASSLSSEGPICTLLTSLKSLPGSPIPPTLRAEWERGLGLVQVETVHLDSLTA